MKKHFGKPQSLFNSYGFNSCQRLLEKLKIEKKYITIKSMKRLLIDDFVVLVGENALENDNLVRNAAPEDIWLHLENMSSAHIVIKCVGLVPPKRVINIAAGFFRDIQKKVVGRYNVIWTEIRNVRLTQTPGCVITSKTRKIKC